MCWAPTWRTGKRAITKHRSRYFCTGTRPRRTSGGISFPWLHRWRIASHGISSGSANRENPAIEYRFADHVRYLDAFLDNAGISSAFVIAQDWGSGLAFHLATRRPDFIRGLAFMEFIRPMPTWNDFHPDQIETFQKFRTPGVGEEMILEGNAFVDGVLPGATVRKLTDEEMSVYRAPFPTPESRRPTWRFPNELPIAGEPAECIRPWRKLSCSSGIVVPEAAFRRKPWCSDISDVRRELCEGA